MNNKAIGIQNYSFSAGDKLLIDANIWLYLFPAPSSATRGFVRTYSAAFKAMLLAKCTIIVNALVLSEYLNRYCRIEWEALHKGSYSSFKAFRQSKDYVGVGQSAADFARAILKQCTTSNDGFADADILNILKEFESGSNDFNDGLIADACLRNSWTLVTHDGDFVNGGIAVLTDNNRLIAACS